jgi:hypothetical protein
MVVVDNATFDSVGVGQKRGSCHILLIRIGENHQGNDGRYSKEFLVLIGAMN